MSKYLMKIIGGLLAAFILFFGGSLLYKEFFTEGGNKVLTELKHFAKSDSLSLDRDKVLDASLDFEVYSTVLTSEGNYSLLQLMDGKIAGEKYEGSLTGRMPSGDLVAYEFSDYWPEFTLADGKKSPASVIERGLTVLHLKNGYYMPIEITSGEIKSGRLVGVVEARTLDAGYSLYLSVKNHKIAEGYLTNMSSYISPAARLSAFIVLKETEFRHPSLTSLEGGSSSSVLAAQTGPSNLNIYNFDNNTLLLNLGTGAYSVVGGVTSSGVPSNPKVVSQINQIIATTPSFSSMSLVSPSISYLLLGSGSITTAMIQDASITAAKIADGTITADKIASGVIPSSTTVSDGAISNSKLADGAVGTSKLADGAVTTAKISDDTITATDLSSSLTFASGDLIDLSAVIHSNTSKQGLVLPNVSSSSPSNPTSGQGYLAYNTADKQVLFYNGTAWGTVGSGTITSVNAGNGLSGGGSSGAVTLSINSTDISGCTSGSTQKIIWDSTNNRLTCGTDQTTGGSASSLSSITAALSSNTISNGDYAQTWNWSLTTLDKTAFKFTESAASTATGNPYILGISTLASSTANPLLVTAGGTSNGVKVDTTGLLQAVGTGGIKATTLNGATFAAPGAIGGTTPGTGAFTTLSATGVITGATATNTINGLIINSGALSGITTISASGQITSTVSTGTAPFVVASTTNVANLNASSLGGATFASPGSIGSTSAGSGVFTTLSASSTLSANGGLTIAANQGLTFTSGTGTATQNYSNTTGTANTLNVTNSGSSGTNSVIGKTIAITGTINGTGSNTTTGINFANVAAATNNTYNGITFGTGFNNYLTSGTVNLTAAGALSGITTISASGQITSTVTTGTAPFVVSSTTNVANLNASSLSGATFAAPGAIGGTTPGTGAFTTLSASGLISANGGLTLAANQNLTFTSGTGTLTQNYSNTTGTSATINHTNSASTGTNTSIALQVALTGTANTLGSNTITALNLPNITAQTNNTFYGLVFGTGLTDILRYNGTQIISGTGVVQSAGISGSYTGITGTGALAAGSIASGFGTIATGNTITGTTLNGTTGINTGASAGTQRIDVTGNLLNIGNVTGTGAVTINTTGNTNGVTINTATGSSGNSGAITIQTGGTTTSGTSGNVTIDVGAGASANGTIGIGTANSGTITIGRSTQGITLPGFTGNNAVLYGTTSTGVLAAATTSTSGLCLLSGAATGYVPAWTTCPGGGGSWSQLTAPSVDLSLAMAANHTTFTWGGNTGVGLDMFKLTDNATNTGTGYILDVAQVAGSAAKPLKITQGANTLVDTTSGGVLTLTSAGAATWGTTTGNLTFQVAGTGTTGNVQIGAGGGGSTTPDFLVVDQATGALPAGTNGAIALDSTGKFNIYEGAWKVLCNKTDLGCGTGSGAALSAITAATAGNTINSGDNAQVWNWQLTTLNKTAFSFGENLASTATGAPYIVGISTLATSTANPLIVTAGGTANGIKIDTTGLLQAIGTGGVKATTLGGATFAAPGAIGGTTPGTGAFTTISASGLISANGGLTLAAGQNLTLTSGIGTVTQNYSNTTGTSATINHTNSASTGTNTSTVLGLAITGTANAVGSNTITGINFPNIVAATNNTYNGVTFGTGFNNYLTSGTVNLTAAGALSGITTLGLSGAITGATATNTINGIIINSGAVSGVSTLGLSGAITGATATNTINGLVINSGALSGITTINTSGQITSTLATGTAPFVVASTTNIPNLNASSLNGATFAAPGAIGGTTPGTGAFTTLSASGLVSANGGLTLAANQNLTLTSGTGTLTQSYTNSVTGSAHPLTLTNSNASITAANVKGLDLSLVGATNANANANTITGINFGNVTPIANNAFNGIAFGTGFNNFLTSGTINVTAAGAITGATGVTFASGNFDQSASGGTFSTGTGAVSLNGLTTLAAGKALIITGGAGSPTATTGTVWYDTTANKFKIVENGVVKILCNTTDLACGTGGGSALSGISAATAGNTINNADNAQVWNWQLTTLNKTAFSFGENLASTATGAPYILGVSTLTGSTANPLIVTAGGTANGVKVDTTGLLQAIGTGGIKATDLAAGTYANALTLSGATNSITAGTLTATGGTINGVNIGATTPGTGAFTTLSASGLVSANGGLTLAANQALTFTLGTGTLTQNYSNTTGTANTINITNSASTGTNTSTALSIAITGTANAAGSNTITGLNFPNVVAATNNTYNGITFGTGFNNYLTSGTVNLTAAGALSGITTINASGQITSTVTTGTAPFVVSSTTNVANLNASSLNGATFAAPGAIGGTTPGSGAFTTLSASGALSANGGLTVAANQNLTFTSGTGTLTQNYSNTTGTQATFNHTNSASTGTNTSTALSIAITGTANALGSNTITGLNFPNVVAATNNTYNGITFGTGFNNYLTSGTINLTAAGAASGLTTLGLSGAITGATATNTINGIIINAGAVSGVSTLGLSGAISGATATNTINGMIINAGAVSGVTTLGASSTVTIGSGGNTFTFNPASGPVYAGTAMPTKKITLTPEYAGATLTGDGTSNTGTMTSDFCSNGATNIPNTNIGVCATAADIHNYYTWTTTQGTAQDYDIWTEWQVPSDFSAFVASPITFYGWRSSISDSVTLTFYTAAGVTCGTATAIAGTVGQWNNTTYTSTGCTPAAGDVLKVRVQLSVGVASEFARAGEVTISYSAKF